MDRPAPTDHDVHQLVRQRWSPRAFADKPVNDATLRRLFEAARWAPSSYNEQPWRFIVGTKDDPEQYNRVLSGFNEFNQKWVALAPVLVVACCTERFGRNDKPNAHAEHDLGQALAWLTVQAEHEGLRVHQCAGIEPDKWVEAFGIPSGVTAKTGVAIGYPAQPDVLPEDLRDGENAPRQRKDLSDIVFGDRFGEASHLVEG